MRLLYGVICEHAGQDAHGRLDIHGVFHDLYAPGFPAKQDRMTLVLVMEWERDDHGRFNFQVDLLGPGGEKSLSLNGHTDVDARDEDEPPARTPLVMGLDEVIFPEPGPYRFLARVKGRDVEGPELNLLRTEPEREPAV